MKKILYFGMFLLIACSASFSQFGYWEKVDSLIIARTHKIICGDSLNCIALFLVAHPDPVLDSCVLGKVSSDGGRTWKKNFHDCFRAMQYDNCSYYWHRPEKFYSLSFPSSIRAFALLDSGKIMYSDNIGKNWNRVIIDSSLLYLFSSAEKGFAMRDDALGIAFAYYPKDTISSPESHLYFTSDAGVKWTEITPNSEEFRHMKMIRVSYPAKDIAKFIAYDSLDENYKLLSYSLVTHNFTLNAIPIAKSSAIAPCLYFQDENTGWIAGINMIDNKFYNTILKTNDGGQSWIKQLEIENFQDRGIFHIEFPNNSIGYALADNYGFRTTNEGLNWTQLKDSAKTKFPRYFTSYAFPTPYSIVATASSGDIYRYSIDFTSIDETTIPHINSSLAIYPNPVSSTNAFTAKIKLRKSANIKLKIYNTLGNLLEEKSSESASDEFEWLIATDRYPTGAYCVRVESDAGENASKVFVVLR